MAVTIKTDGDIYKYTIEAKILLNEGKDIQELKEHQIQYMYVDYDYYKYNMPMIFLSIAIDKNVLDKMIKFSNNSVINLTVYKYISNSNSTIKSVYFQEQFAYFMGKDYNANKGMDYSYINEKRVDVLENITIGLLKVDHINKNKKKFSGVISNSSLSAAIYYCCNGLPLLLEPIKHDKNIKQLILPPITSVSKAIAFLNNNFQAFYNSPYRFFMDFSTTYLISSDGKPVVRKGDKINSVIINIRKSENIASYIQGLYTNTKNKIYEIDIGQNDVYVVENTSAEKTFNKMAVASSNGGIISSVKLDNNRSKFINDKEEIIRVPNNNTTLVTNKQYELEMSNVVLELSKNDIDSSVFTINKEYSIKASEAYSGRDGKYILTKKKEVFVRDNDHMVLNVLLTFKKVPGK